MSGETGCTIVVVTSHAYGHLPMRRRYDRETYGGYETQPLRGRLDYALGGGSSGAEVRDGGAASTGAATAGDTTRVAATATATVIGSKLGAQAAMVTHWIGTP